MILFFDLLQVIEHKQPPRAKPRATKREQDKTQKHAIF